MITEPSFATISLWFICDIWCCINVCFLLFLADRNNARAYGTKLCPFVISLSVVCNICIVAKQYVSSENCLRKQVGTGALWCQFRPPVTPHSSKWGYWLHRQILALRIAAKPLELAAWLLLTAYRNLPTPYPTVPSPTTYGQLFSQNRGPDPKKFA